MRCLDDCHTYEMDTFLKGKDGHENCVLLDHIQVIHFYEMRESGDKFDGVTNEEVLRVLIHRLKFLNEEWHGGKFRCRENSIAITKLEEALMWLNKRTEDRVARKVEGSHSV